MDSRVDQAYEKNLRILRTFCICIAINFMHFFYDHANNKKVVYFQSQKCRQGISDRNCQREKTGFFPEIWF